MKRVLPKTILLVIACASCSGGGSTDTTGDTQIVTDQEPQDQTTAPWESSYAFGQLALEAGDFDTVVSGSSELGSLRDQLTADGFTIFVRGTRLTLDPDRVVEAGLYAHANGGTRTLIHACWSDDCTVSIAETSGSDYNLLEGPGFPDDNWPIPVLAKELVIGESGSLFNLDNPTQTLPAGLELATVAQTWDLDRRKFEVITPLGSRFDHSAVEGILDATFLDRFQDVTFTTRVDRMGLETSFLSSDALDVLVIYGPTILQIGSTGPDGNSYKAVGVSVALDPIIDATFNHKDFRTLIGQAPFYGPGTLVLLGCDSLLNFDPETKDSLMQELSRSYSNASERNTTHLLVGWTGCANISDLADSLEGFLSAVYGGDTIQNAVNAVNQQLNAAGGDAEIVAVLGTDVNPELALPEVAQTGWEGITATGGELIGRLQTIPECDKGNGNYVLGIESDALIRAKPLTWNGTAFEGGWDQPGSHGTVVGVLNDPSPGATFHYVYVGSPADEVQNIVLFAEALIESVENQGNKLVVNFGGKARFSTYTNDLGENCTLNQIPNLRTATSDLSRLLIDFSP
jgi:hypothetical protein